uniref:Transmembrane protein n=1 Tax=Strongyloides papillosus TaxID=174720 RepID=A0A0N5CEI3_STREA
MVVLYTLLLLFLNFMQLEAQNYFTGDNSSLSDCMSNCVIDSNGKSCFDRLLNFVENDVVSQIRHYVAVQINIDQFHRRHNKSYESEWDAVKNNSTLTMGEKLLENDIVSKNTISQIVSTLIDAVSGESKDIIIWTAHYSCPITCNQYQLSWRNVFVCSIILNFGLLVGVLPLFLTTLKRMQINNHMK